MIVGVGLVAVLAAVIIIALLLNGPGPGTAADATATATPSASATAPASRPASPSGSALHSPTATLVAAPTPPELPAGLLPAGAVVTVNTEVLRIRARPSLDARVLHTMAQGDAAYIENIIGAGPIRADGYDWYWVSYANGRDVWPFQDVQPGNYVSGWMAAGDRKQRYVTLAQVSCPSGPITLAMLADELTPWARLVCMGDGTVTIDGRFGCDGCGGLTPGATPEWLADQAQGEIIAARGNLYPAVQVALPPKGSAPKTKDVVRATLHVNDPAASTCAYAPPSGGGAPAVTYDAAAVHIFCQERLVLESFKVIGHDDFPPS